MSLAVHLFGPYADVAGTRSVEIELREHASLSANAVIERLAIQVPELRPLLRSSRLAVNCECVPGETQVREGDELAIIGLVSGG
ncbi:MAG: MoaD/ThiS family protein [Phycisphaerales bacterium]